MRGAAFVGNINNVANPSSDPKQNQCRRAFEKDLHGCPSGVHAFLRRWGLANVARRRGLANAASAGAIHFAVSAAAEDSSSSGGAVRPAVIVGGRAIL